MKPVTLLPRLVMTLAGVCAAPAVAVRVNPDGHGQALIFPYFTARASATGNAFVTAVSVTNTADVAKAVKVRILEGKAGAEVFDFNLYLAAHDVWTAGIVGAGAGAGIFTADHSCTSAPVSTSSVNPGKFRNAAYVGDTLGSGLDRTYEGYLEVLEMGSIAPGSALEVAITPALDQSASNASKPSCANLSTAAADASALLRPTGGLIGNASYININEGTDYNADAIALSQWSDKPQWSAPGSPQPTLADASPSQSVVIVNRDGGDALVSTRWDSGRDAVSALFMTGRLTNDFSVEPAIKAATDWIVTMPTKRFHVRGAQTTPPFADARLSNSSVTTLLGEEVSIVYYDREQASPGEVSCAPLLPCGQFLPYATTTIPWFVNFVTPGRGTVMSGASLAIFDTVMLNSLWTNGWGDLRLDTSALHQLVAPKGSSTIVNSLTGTVTAGVTLTYFGLPVVGFAAQSYSTSGLPGINPNVLSNYGGAYVHKVTRRIEAAQ